MPQLATSCDPITLTVCVTRTHQALPANTIFTEPLPYIWRGAFIFAARPTFKSSDDLGDTIDYSAMTAELERVLTNERFTLLERLAQRLCDVLLVDERVRCVTISVRKLRPPVPQQLETTGVRITRGRS